MALPSVLRTQRRAKDRIARAASLLTDASVSLVRRLTPGGDTRRPGLQSEWLRSDWPSLQTLVVRARRRRIARRVLRVVAVYLVVGSVTAAIAGVLLV